MPVLDQVIEKYAEKVKIVFKNYPNRSHRFSWKAAAAALAAGRQGKFWEFHDRLFKEYDRLSILKIQEISRELGLDIKRFQKDMEDPEIAAMIQRDMSEAAALGVRGTPTIFVNGRMLKNRSMEGFQEAVEKELKECREAEGRKAP